jgi:hypothetical protein
VKKVKRLNQKKIKIKNIKYKQKIERKPPGPPEYDYYTQEEERRVEGTRRSRKDRLSSTAVFILIIISIASNLVAWHNIQIVKNAYKESTITETTTINYGERIKNLENKVEQLRGQLILSDLLNSMKVYHRVEGENLNITLILPELNDRTLEANYIINITVIQADTLQELHNSSDLVFIGKQNIIKKSFQNQLPPGRYITEIQLQPVNKEFTVQRIIEWSTD